MYYKATKAGCQVKWGVKKGLSNQARRAGGTEGRGGRGEWAGRVLALLLAVLITVAIVIYRERIKAWAVYGYPGIFLVSLLSNATVVFPVPGLAFTFAMGGVLHPLLVGLVAGVGEALGELTGYLAGYGGRVIIEKRQTYERLESWMRRYGAATIFTLSAIPNPMFDLAGMAAGALRFPLWRFLLVCWMGKTIKTILFALAGAYSIPFLERLLG